MPGPLVEICPLHTFDRSLLEGRESGEGGLGIGMHGEMTPRSERGASAGRFRKRRPAVPSPGTLDTTHPNLGVLVPRALIHTMLRILDEQRSLAFYEALGFSETGRSRVGGNTATIIFMALPGDGDRLELTLNDGRTEPYELGEAYGHIALSVDDIDAELAQLAAKGISPERPPYASRPGGSVICFIADPDGYRIELVQTR